MESLLSVNGISSEELIRKRSLSTRYIQKFIPEIEEIRLNPIISRKGYLLFFDDRIGEWIKRHVIVRRPYLLLYQNDRDPLERSIINLSRAEINYDEKQVNQVRK